MDPINIPPLCKHICQHHGSYGFELSVRNSKAFVLSRSCESLRGWPFDHVWPPWSGTFGLGWWSILKISWWNEMCGPKITTMLAHVGTHSPFFGYTVYLSILAYGCCFLNWLWFQSLLILSLAGLMSVLSDFHNEQVCPAVNYVHFIELVMIICGSEFGKRISERITNSLIKNAEFKYFGNETR